MAFRSSRGGAGDRLAADLYEKMGGGRGSGVRDKPRPSRPPNFLMCYLCGQQFGKSSLPIHQPQCYVKKLLQWERGDPATRGSRPIHPDEMAQRQQEVAAAGGDDIAVSGDAGGGAGGMGGGKSAVDAFNEAQYKAFEQNMVPCENCGRTFFPDRLAVHQRSCHAGARHGGSKPVNRAASGGRAAVPARHADPGGGGAAAAAPAPAPAPSARGPSPRTAAASARVPPPRPAAAASEPAPSPPGGGGGGGGASPCPKFCQECGTRFSAPVKFCSECGYRVGT